MSEFFSIGEIVITVIPDKPEFHNVEVEIMSAPVFCTDVYDTDTKEDIAPGMFYHVKWPDGDETVQWPHELRKKKPPMDWAALAYSKPRDVETTEQDRGFAP